MNGKRYLQHSVFLGALLLVAGSTWADGNSPPPAPQPDVTMMVIPAGQDVLQTVVQTINVPAKIGAQTPSRKTPGGKDHGSNPPGPQTAPSTQQIEGTKAEPQAGQHEAGEAAQQAGEAAEHQAQQARQAQQQAQALTHQQPHPSPPPPTPHGPPGG
jgi:hypothetical protein